MIAKLTNWYAKNRMYRQTYKELSSLSIQELRDLGLTYNSIKQIALEAAYGKEISNV